MISVNRGAAIGSPLLLNLYLLMIHDHYHFEVYLMFYKTTPVSCVQTMVIKS